jgi:hypothetical protein
MSIEVWESPESPKLIYADEAGQGTPSGKTIFFARGSEDRGAIRSAIETQAPTAISAGGQVLVRATMDMDWIGPDVFRIECNYAAEQSEQAREQPAPGAWKFSWDTTGGSLHITTARGLVDQGEDTPTYPAPALGRVIGWDGKKVIGCDIVVPKLQFQITAYYAPATVTTSFVANLARATGKTNNAAWLGFAVGELLFMGSTGDKDLPLAHGTRTNPVAVNLKFSASENREDIYLTDSFVIPEKKGWEHLTVTYREKVNGTTGVTTAVPNWYYVHRVYDSISFASVFGF